MTHWTIRDDDERSISSDECPWLESAPTSRRWTLCGDWRNETEFCEWEQCPRKEEK